VLEERASRGDLREGRADAPCPDDENPHGGGVLHDPGCSAHCDPDTLRAISLNGGRA
jgi:hypothetical protein